MSIFKSFIRPHLDYGDVVYDWTSNESFQQSHESIQYSAIIARTGSIRETTLEFFQEKNPNPNIKTLAEKIMPFL